MKDAVDRLTPLGVMVLALLGEGDMHPYEMIRLMRFSAATIGSSRSPTARCTTRSRRLERAGLLAEVGVDRDGNRPERTTYAVTDAGREAVTEWVRRELPRVDRPRRVPHRARRGAQPRPRARSSRCCARVATRCGRSAGRASPRDARPPSRKGVPDAVPARARARGRAARGGPRVARSTSSRAWRADDFPWGSHDARARTLSRTDERPHGYDRTERTHAPSIRSTDRTRAQPVAGPLGARHRVLHDPRRHDDRLGREPRDQGGARPRHEQPRQRRVGDLGVPARVRGAAAHHRAPRRPLRPEEHLPDRARGLHPRLARRAACRARSSC